jgi:hypothetical protein
MFTLLAMVPFVFIFQVAKLPHINPILAVRTQSLSKWHDTQGFNEIFKTPKTVFFPEKTNLGRPTQGNYSIG